MSAEVNLGFPITGTYLSVGNAFGPKHESFGKLYIEKALEYECKDVSSNATEICNVCRSPAINTPQSMVI